MKQVKTQNKLNRQRANSSVIRSSSDREETNLAHRLANLKIEPDEASQKKMEASIMAKYKQFFSENNNG